ncbi:MAG: hypothetical protein WA230_16550, partial [Xanthobacteraceae bacterium]
SARVTTASISSGDRNASERRSDMAVNFQGGEKQPEIHKRSRYLTQTGLYSMHCAGDQPCAA